MSRTKQIEADPLAVKLNEVIKLMQLSIAISLCQAGANQGSIAKSLGLRKTTVNKMLAAVPKKKNNEAAEKG